MTETLNIADIRRDGETQTRVQTDMDVVKEYADDMRNGDTFPPVTVFHDGANYWLADGFHRVHAALQVGSETIEADVQTGSKRDALFTALAANQKRGLHRRNIDKRHCVRLMLDDNEWGTWSNRKIAEHCGVSKDLVASVRKELEGNNSGVNRQSLTPALITGNDNRVYEVSKFQERVRPPLPENTPRFIRDAVDQGAYGHYDARRRDQLLSTAPDWLAAGCQANMVTDNAVIGYLIEHRKTETVRELLASGRLQWNGDDDARDKQLVDVTVHDLRMFLDFKRREHERAGIETQREKARQEARRLATMKARFNVVYADPPWSYSNSG